MPIRPPVISVGRFPVHYRIISVTSGFSPKRARERLVKQVNEAIALGWEPQGGVFVHGTQLHQAMVRRR